MDPSSSSSSVSISVGTAVSSQPNLFSSSPFGVADFTMLPSNRMTEHRLSCVGKCVEVLDCLSRSPSPVLRLMMDTSRAGAASEYSGTGSNCEDNNLIDACGSTTEKNTPRLATDGDEDLGPMSDSNGVPIFKSLSKDDFNFPHPSGGRLGVYYSDLYFTSLEEKADLEKSLASQILAPPAADVAYGKASRNHAKHIIILQRAELGSLGESTLPSYQGIGWGFEVVRWKEPAVAGIRVGRVHPKSPAAVAGLQMHDVLTTINGRVLGAGVDWSINFLCCAFLASPLCGGPSNNKFERVASVLSEVGCKGVARGPVVLEVFRPHVAQRPGPMVNSPPVQEQRTSPNSATTTTWHNRQHQRQVLIAAAPSTGQSQYQRDIHHGHAPVAGAKLDQNISHASASMEGGAPTHLETDEMMLLPLADSPVREEIRNTNDTTGSRQTGTSISRQDYYDRQLTSEQNQMSDATNYGFRSQSQPSPEGSFQAPETGGAQDDNEVVIVEPVVPQPLRLPPSLERASHVLLPAIQNLFNGTALTVDRRRPVSSRNLYVALGYPSVLTEIEAAVLLESVQRNMPMLGFRVLCPRYHLDTVAKQAILLSNSGMRQLQKIPKISDGMWNGGFFHGRRSFCCMFPLPRLTSAFDLLLAFR
jgi:hypothetical protein